MFESFAWDQLIQRAKVRRAIKFESFLKRVWDYYLWRKFGNFKPISNQLELATSYSSFTVETENLKKICKLKISTVASEFTYTISSFNITFHSSLPVLPLSLRSKYQYSYRWRVLLHSNASSGISSGDWLKGLTVFLFERAR